MMTTNPKINYLLNPTVSTSQNQSFKNAFNRNKAMTQ